MKPKSLSSTAVHVLEMCPARAVAENLKRTPNTSGSAAELGTSVHNALEAWGRSGAMTDPKASIDDLLKVYDREYAALFGSNDDRLDEGREMIRTWYERTHPIEHEIVSVEVKESFPIRVTWRGEKVEVPFNYIWDRCDRLPNGDIDVVDYKTISFPLNADQMRQKIQVRAYGLAAQIKFPEARRIWVTYDMLRHGEPLGVSFSREDNVATYRFLQDVLRRVLDIDPNNPEERINEECRWCIRKQVCRSLQKHAEVGGVHAISDPVEAAKKRNRISNAMSGMKAALEELDAMLLNHMKREDILSFDADGVRVEAAAGRRRKVDPEQVRRRVPDEVWSEYGGHSLTMKQLDRLLKDDRLDAKSKQEIRGLISFEFSEPSIKTKPIRADEDK